MQRRTILKPVTPNQNIMARINNPWAITPAIIASQPGLCFYKMEGELHVRTKSSLSSERVKKSAAFRLTMAHAGVFGQAATLASGMFQQISLAKRHKGLYKQIIRVAIYAIRAATPADVVIAMLEEQFLRVAPVVRVPAIDCLPADRRKQRRGMPGIRKILRPPFTRIPYQHRLAVPRQGIPLPRQPAHAVSHLHALIQQFNPFSKIILSLPC